MNRKLYVPDRMVPKPPKNVFKIEENKNSDDPSKMEKSALERLPQPTGYRILVIPYYMKTQTKGGVYVPDATRDRESFATVAAYVVKLGASAYKDVGRFPDGAWCKESRCSGKGARVRQRDCYSLTSDSWYRSNRNKGCYSSPT